MEYSSKTPKNLQNGVPKSQEKNAPKLDFKRMLKVLLH
jgi:hypothetical protein